MWITDSPVAAEALVDVATAALPQLSQPPHGPWSGKGLPRQAATRRFNPAGIKDHKAYTEQANTTSTAMRNCQTIVSPQRTALGGR